MAVVNLPGGGRLTVPDGSTPEQIRAAIAKIERTKRNERSFEASREEFARAPGAVKALTGFGATFAEPVMGIKQAALKALGEPTEGLEEQIATIRGARAGSGWLGTGGEAAAWLVPGGGATKAAMRYLPQAGKLLPAALAGGAENALYEGSRATLGGDPSRLERAGTGFLWGAGGGAAGSALARAPRGVAGGVAEVSPEARRVLGQFRRAGMEAPLTVGQTIGGKTKRFEESLSGVPFTGLPGAYERGLKAWNTATLTNAVRKHLGPVATAGRAAFSPQSFPAGHKGFRNLSEGINELYESLFSKLDPNVTMKAQTGFPNFAAAAGNLRGEQEQLASQVLARLTAKLEGKGLPATQVKEMEAELRHIMENAYQNGHYDLGDALSGLREDFRELFTHRWTPYSKQVLQSADALYGATRPMVEAGATQGALVRKGVFTPSQMISRIRANARPSQLAAGNVPGLRAAESANEVIGSRLPEVGPGTAEKLLGSGAVGTVGAIAAGLANPIAGVAAALPLATAQFMGSPTAARALTGRTGVQRLLMSNPKFKAAVEALARQHGVSADVAAAMLVEQMGGSRNAP